MESDCQKGRRLESALNADQMPSECLLDTIRMLAYVLGDCDELHKQGHMDPSTFGAIVSLAVSRLEQMTTECTLNAS